MWPHYLLRVAFTDLRNGWTDEERKEANQNNFRDVTLGITIFRAETARKLF